MMIIGSLAAYGAIGEQEVVWSYSKTNDYRVPHSWELDVLGIEESAYTDILRVVDEVNKERGIAKRYVLSNGRIPELTDDVDMVPIYIDTAKNYQGEGKYTTVAKNKYYKPETLKNILDKKEGKEFDDFSYSYMQQEMRYYFGNGNKVQDIIIQDKDNFEKTIKDKNEKNQKEYLINGVYQSIDSSGIFNTLGITAKEFKENFYENGKPLDPHNKKVLEFLKTKLEAKGVNKNNNGQNSEIIVKNGELWTKGKDGKEHRVIWNANLASRPEFPSGEVLNFLEKSLKNCKIECEIKGEKLLLKENGNSKTALWKIDLDETSKEKLDKDTDLMNFLRNAYNNKDENFKFTKINDNTIKIEGKDGTAVKLYVETAKGDVKDISWYKNTLLTQFSIFKEFDGKGKILYTKDGGIIIEDVIDYSKLDPKKKADSYWGSPEKIEKDNKLEGKIHNEIISDYSDMKEKKITKEQFEEKWDLKNDGNYEQKLSKIKTENDKLQQYKKQLSEKISKMGGDSYGSLYYGCFDSWNKDNNMKEILENPEKLKDYKLSSELIKELKIEEKNAKEEAKKILKKLFEETKEIKEKIEKLEKEIPEKLKETKIDRISNSDVIIDRYGKRIEFRGRGRVDGTIDFGKGDNRLKISEQSTGRYGTNIIFGPYVKLKNINYIAIGGQYSAATGGVGLSGKSSLTLEIDTTKVNEKGRLYQHALKDTWTDNNKIVLKSWEENPINRNNFAIELKVSSLSKDMEIDMGRPLEYKAKAFYEYLPYSGEKIKVGDIITYKTNFYSDSIAHDLVLINQGNEEKKENGILGVKIKDSLLLLNENENAVFKSMATSGNLGYLSDTLTTSNKKTKFASSVEEDRFEAQKIYNLIENIVEQKSAADILKLSSHFQIPKEKQDELQGKIDKIKKEECVTKAVEQLKTLENYKKIDLKVAINDMSTIVKEYQGIVPPDGIGYADQERVKEKMKEKFKTEAAVQAEMERIQKYAKDKFSNILEKLDNAKPKDPSNELIIGGAASYDKIVDRIRGGLKELKEIPTSSYKSKEILLAEYVYKFKALEIALEKLDSLTKNDIYDHIKAELELDASRKEKSGEDWIDLISNIFYTQRQTESLKELKTIISQLSDNNIYAKVNKISKNEIDVFNHAVTDSNFDIDTKKAQASGGAISGRFSRDKFKGTIYSGYGIYETPIKDDLSLGLVVGGGTSSFHEIKNDDIKTVTTNSKIKGTRAYLGAFERKNLKKDLNWINGVGFQYATYDVDREMRNHYQSDVYKGKVNTYSGNVYSNLIYDYKINDTLNANIKGGLSYTLVNQGKATEENKPLAIEVKEQNFNYLDGQLGVGLTKTIFGDNITSSLSGTFYTMYGLIGYDNKNLKGRIVGSPSEFSIKGQNYEKQSVKLSLNYNVVHHSGFNYGLEGSYTKNSNEDNISVGIRAGYSF